MALFRTKLIDRDWLIGFKAPAVNKRPGVQGRLGAESL